MCRTLYVAKTVGIGCTTSTAVKETHVPSRGMRQTDVLMEKERASDGNGRMYSHISMRILHGKSET